MSNIIITKLRLFRVLYDNSVSCVRIGGTHSSWFKIDWLLDRTVESCSIGVAFGQSSFTDLDFADDVYLGSLIHSSTGSTCDINRRSAITHAAMQSLENQIWRSRLAISTKLKLYNTCILPIFLYGSDCWAMSKTDACKIDALDQWCLHMLLGITWYQFVRNDDVRRLTKQPQLTQSHRLTLFGHIMCTDDNADRGSCWSPLWQTGEDNWVVPASHGSAPSNRI